MKMDPVVPIRAAVLYQPEPNFFEHEIQQQLQAPVKPVNKQPLVSPYEVDRMKQEEDRKIACMGPMEYIRPTELEQVVEEEEEMEMGDDDELSVYKEKDDVVGSQGADLAPGEPDANAERASGHTRPISASSVSSVSSTGSVRTAKAEKRLKERLHQEGAYAHMDQSMSPSEQRALQAEKRAAWRQARLKSLEQDALQAQIVLNRINEIIDSPNPNEDGVDNPEDAEGEDEPKPEKNISIVETTEQKIISIELEGGPVSPTSEEGNSSFSVPTSTNSSRKKKRRNSKKK